MQLRLLTLLLLWAIAAAALAQGVDAELDRNRIVDGETLNLTLTVPGDLDGEPDLSVLRQDFDILGSSQSTHTSVINGNMSSRRQWQLSLSPKRTGMLTVPPIPVGRTRSPALGLQVLEADSQAAGNESPGIFMEVEATPETPYVQQQITYKVRIFHRIQLQEARLDAPQADGALIEQLGEDRSYRVYRNGHRYGVIERSYALFPQKSGSLRIQGPSLTASMVVESKRRSPFGMGRDPFGGFPNIGSMFSETRPMRVRGKALDLEIRPQAAGTVGTWLPAQSLTLQEQWSSEPLEFRVGEPVTRTLTLHARGLTASQLPIPQVPDTPGLKAYPDQPQADSRAADGAMEASKQLKIALVPTRPGQFELPEVRIDWWDTEAERARHSLIPARSIQVLPAIVDKTAITAPPNITQVPAGTETPEQTLLPAAPTAAKPKAISGPWPWISAALALAWLMTLGLWWRERRRPGHPATREKTSAQGNDTSTPRDIQRACRDNDPARTRRELLHWARRRWPERPPGGLGALADRLDSAPIQQALRELDQTLYGEAATTWNGSKAWESLAPLFKQGARKTIRKQAGPLPELYPQVG